MPRYNYACQSGCKLSDVKSELKDVVIIVAKSGRLIWEEAHSIKITPSIKCPLCRGAASITLEGVLAPVSYIRGYGYLDKAGCRRNMNLHKLTTDDPYAHMRERGEADDLKCRLKKGKTPVKKYFA
jgi:hypothetical protein